MLNMPKMREIDVGRSTWRTKEMIAAIAWATNRRGHNSWKVSEETRNRSVSNDILAYLKAHNVKLDDGWTGPRITYVLKLLAGKGFAKIRMHVYGVSEFKFDDDVILSGYMPDFFDQVTVNPSVEKVAERVEEAIQLPPAKILNLPMPGVKPPRYRADAINDLLDRYADVDPDGYADYADKLVTLLTRSLNT